MSKSEKQGNYLSPKQFLKSRRPKQFSDTIMSENKSMTELNLNTISQLCRIGARRKNLNAMLSVYVN